MSRLTRLVVLCVAVLISTHRLAEAGVSFVRWGRTACPEGTHRLYKGYMAGPHYATGGSGSNHLCVHEEPKFERGKPGRQGWSGLIMGVEFDYSDSLFGDVMKHDNIPSGTILNNDAPCAVCYVAESTDKIMIPGRPDCGNTGYDFQYKGFLVAQSHENRMRSEYVCMDEAPEGRVGGSGEDNNSVVYMVEISCGSLPCNPFVDGMEMPCAICTY